MVSHGYRGTLPRHGQSQGNIKVWMTGKHTNKHMQKGGHMASQWLAMQAN